MNSEIQLRVFFSMKLYAQSKGHIRVRIASRLRGVCPPAVTFDSTFSSLSLFFAEEERYREEAEFPRAIPGGAKEVLDQWCC